MRIEPAFERAVFLFEFQYLLRVDNGRVHFQSVADNARIFQQTDAVCFGIFGDLHDVEFTVRFAKVIRLLQDGDPRQTRLIDLKDEALEQFIIIVERKSVLGVVIISIECIFGMGDAVFAVGCHRLISMIGRMRG